MKSLTQLLDESIKTVINEAHGVELFTITYGTAKERVGHEIKVMCDDKTIDAVAIAIYKGHNQSGPGWCYYTNSKGKQTMVADCM